MKSSIIPIILMLLVSGVYASTIDETQIYDLIKLNSSSALCLDGTNAGYYISRTGDINKILLYFEGGGWCYGLNQDQTIKDCYQRSFKYTGSSKFYQPHKYLFEGHLSKHQNNYFKDWKKIFIEYCDGAGHQGSRKEPINYKGNNLYFRGYNITTEILEDVQKRFNMYSKATQVVVSGVSAGGIAVFHWTNYIAQRVKVGKVWAFADGAVFLDEFSSKKNRKLYRQRLTNNMKFSNAQIDIPVPQCIVQNRKNKVNCFFVQNLYKHLKVPIFLTQSLYDVWSLQNIVDIGCINWQRKNTTIINCNFQQLKYIEQYHIKTTNLLNKIVQKKQNAVWAPVCLNHAFIIFDMFYDIEYRIPQLSQYSMSQTVGRWMEGKLDVNGEHQNSLIEEGKWPNNRPCSGVKGQKYEMLAVNSYFLSSKIVLQGLGFALIVVLGFLLIGKKCIKKPNNRDAQAAQLLCKKISDENTKKS